MKSDCRYCRTPGTSRSPRASADAGRFENIAVASANKCKNNRKLTAVRPQDWDRTSNALEDSGMGVGWEGLRDAPSFRADDGREGAPWGETSVARKVAARRVEARKKRAGSTSDPA